MLTKLAMQLLKPLYRAKRFTAGKTIQLGLILVLVWVNLPQANVQPAFAAANPVAATPAIAAVLNQAQQLVDTNSPDAGDQFGWSTALSSDGNTALIGIRKKKIGSNTIQGAVYVFTRAPGSFTLAQVLTAADGAPSDNFGSGVALSSDGNTALIGAYGKSINGNSFQGAAYIFRRNAFGQPFAQTQQLTASDGTSSDYFGEVVALSGDGNTALISATGKTVGINPLQGATYVFSRANFGANFAQVQRLIASDGMRNDNFGFALALNNDGKTAVIGNNAFLGAAYVFTRAATTFVEVQVLEANDPEDDDHFGSAVTLSDDGATMLIGAYGKTVNSNVRQGKAYVFGKTGLTASYAQSQELLANDGLNFSWFGRTVALSRNGAVALISSPFKNFPGKIDQGAAYIFDQPGSVTPTSAINLLPSTVRVASTLGDNASPRLVATGANPSVGNSSSVQLAVGGTNGIPNGASGVTGILTNVNCNGGGNLRFWTGSTVPNSVNLNIPASSLAIPGATFALNLSTSFIAPLDTSGKFYLGWGSTAGKSCGYAVDISGYLTPSSPVKLLPGTVRVASTFGNTANPRLVATAANPSVGNSSSVQLTVAGTNGIPANATGIAGILTNVQCDGGGNLRFWPGSTVPDSINLNVAGSSLAIPGATSALNLSTSFIVPLDANGKVNLGWGSTVGKRCGYAVDVIGYIAPTSANGNVNLLPSTLRVASTIGANAASLLVGVTNGPIAGTTSSRTIAVGGTGSIPAGAKGIIGIVTNIDCNSGGNLRFWIGNTVPNSINLNVAGSSLAIPNASFALNLSTGFIAPLDANGKVNLGWSSAVGKSCGYAVDITGYF